MRPDPEAFRSAFISQNRAAANRGSFSSFLSGSSPSDGFAAGMQSSLAPPQGTNRRSQQAYAQAGDSLAAKAFDSGLGSLTASQDQAMQLGSSGLRSTQALGHAHQMAKVSAQGRKQAQFANAVSTGISTLGGIYGSFQPK